MKKGESVDLALILIWPVIAAALSYLFKPNSFLSVILFLTLPAIYLSFKEKKHVKKSALFSLVIMIPTMIVIDYVSHLTGDWNVISSILPWRLFGFVTIEVILWAFSACYFILIFYEYFINKHRSKEIWGPRMKYLVGFELFIFISFLIVLFILPRLLNIPYFYFKWGIILTLFPFLVQLFKYPKTTAKFFLEAAYFFYLHFIYEVAALNLGWWSFPGKFIGWVNIFNVAFPIEEVLFWFILLALSILSYYEFFDDDEK